MTLAGTVLSGWLLQVGELWQLLKQVREIPERLQPFSLSVSIMLYIAALTPVGFVSFPKLAVL
ncbi:hypothetical protein PAENIP36_09210 [Paenibacillus sp. P36]